MNKIEQAESILKKYNQNHIKIKTEEQAEQILEIDFAQLEELYQYAINKKNTAKIHKHTLCITLKAFIYILHIISSIA